MTPSTELLRPVSAEEADAYRDDGVVCLRQVIDPRWMEAMRPAAEQIAAAEQDFGLLPTYPGRYLARTIESFRRFVFDSPLGEAAAAVLRSTMVRFFFDELFAKAPRSADATIWHTDRMGWPVTGQMVPSLWIPLTSVAEADGLECIADSHTRDVRYWLFSPNARQMIKPPDRASHPDEAALRADPDNRFLSWAMEPGDVLVVHPWTLHYSHGNHADHWRLALSVRVFGDDIRWQPRPDCVNLAGVSFDEMIPDEPPAGPLFPVLWSQDGRRDDDSEFPRGFATTWSRQRRAAVNEGEEFRRRLQAERQR
jgi:ectoine hydroxylase-related dioxygenase (phytanoyl-CoA dioxygenase family)